METKLTFVFNDEDLADKTKLNQILKASEAHDCLHEIGQQLFREARKHGYQDTAIRQAYESGDVEKTIELLENKFYLLLAEYKLEL